MIRLDLTMLLNKTFMLFNRIVFLIVNKPTYSGGQKIDTVGKNYNIIAI